MKFIIFLNSCILASHKTWYKLILSQNESYNCITIYEHYTFNFKFSLSFISHFSFFINPQIFRFYGSRNDFQPVFQKKWVNRLKLKTTILISTSFLSRAHSHHIIVCWTFLNKRIYFFLRIIHLFYYLINIILNYEITVWLCKNVY